MCVDVCFILNTRHRELQRTIINGKERFTIWIEAEQEDRSLLVKKDRNHVKGTYTERRTNGTRQCTFLPSFPNFTHLKDWSPTVVHSVF